MARSAPATASADNIRVQIAALSALEAFLSGGKRAAASPHGGWPATTSWWITVASVSGTTCPLAQERRKRLARISLTLIVLGFRLQAFAVAYF